MLFFQFCLSTLQNLVNIILYYLITMDYKMEINYLKKDEIRVELLLRGVSTTDDQTVDDLRTLLRPLIKLEKSGKSLRSPEVTLDFKEEQPIIEKKLQDLIPKISDIKGDNSLSKFTKIQTGLMHLLHRCDHIPSTDKISSARSQLISKILAALDKLEEVFKNDPYLSLTCTNSNLSQNTSSTSNVSMVTSQPIMNNQPSTSTPSSNKHLPLYKWDIKFSGDSDDLSVYEFLEQIKELSIARNVSEHQLFDSAYEFLVGKARKWFVNNRNRFNDWKSLSDLLILHYSTPDYKSRLFENILHRTQDVNEPIIEYLNCMKSMFRRYGDISEQMQLDILVRNLAPFYLSQLPDISS